MTVLNIFVSYSSKNRRIVKNFVLDLEAMGHNVWLDVDGLSGGHEWWAKILEEIRHCDLFIAALSTHYFRSEPCKRELNYAHTLGKHILPVSFANIRPQTLPSYLQEIQIIEYQHGNKEQLLKLVKALNILDEARSLPNQLPEEPEIPLPPIATLRDRIDNLSPQLDEQRLIIAGLKDLTENEDMDLAAWELLEQLSENDGLLAKPAQELADIMSSKPQDITYRRRLAALEPRTFEGHAGPVTSVAFSPDAQFVLTGSEDFTARIWNATTGEVIHQLNSHTDIVTSVAYSHNGEYAVTGCADHIARLWATNTGKAIRQFEGHSDSISCVAFASNDLHFLTGSKDGTVRLWDTDELSGVRKYEIGTHVYTVDFAPDETQFLAAGLKGTIKLYDFDSDEASKEFGSDRSIIDSAKFSLDGSMILAGGRDPFLQLWDAERGIGIRPLIGHKNSVQSVVFAPFGEYVASGCYSNTVRIWDFSTGKQLKVFNLGANVNSIAFSPDAKYILAGTSANNAHLISLEIPG